MIDPATSWFEIVELLVSQLSKQKKEPYFDKTSATVGSLINRIWFCHYPCSQYIVYDNQSEFKLHFKTLCKSYGLKRKLTSVKNSQANAILEHVHQTIMGMHRIAEIKMANTVSESDRADFITNASWVVGSTYHMVLKASPGAAIFVRDMLFHIPFIADWNKIEDYRQLKVREKGLKD